jgi:ABC-2 type transport system ATP-binding protein
LTLRFDEPVARPPALLGSSRWEGFGREWTVVCPGSIDEICVRAAGVGAQIIEDRCPTLEDIFVAHAASAKTNGVEGA